MTPAEYRTRVILLEKQIERNNKIHCNFVAARYERQLAALKKEYEDSLSCHPQPVPPSQGASGMFHPHE